MISVKKSDNAVSPVVGVMLMLVVTIIIAAVVATFASGLTTDVSGTPQAIFSPDDMTTVAGYGDIMYLANITFTHKGGDYLQVSDIKVTLKCDGNTITYTPTGYLWDNKKAQITGVTGGVVQVGDVMTLSIINTTSGESGISTGFASGKVVEYTVIDTNNGNSIAYGDFIVSA